MTEPSQRVATRSGYALEKIGLGLLYIGGASFVGVFAIVLLNGRWSDFLSPIRDLFGFLSSWAGNFAFIIELWLFIGPGLALYWIGRRMQGYD
jgi:hypothetical protein